MLSPLLEARRVTFCSESLEMSQETTAVSKIRYIPRRTETLSDIAESFTAGDVMATTTSVPSTSGAFCSSIISYATPLNQLLLKVDSEPISS
ncbi:hypothetical protein F5Y16DRAFT_378865 [Xylariaceae sp. FL0255]|nr:hypothetical protein F5Y16DRAFT_378865 [Xylariaceae sp. FL0255]